MSDSTPGVALVTGASRGLGVAMAKALARDGWTVAVNYARDTCGAERVVEDIVHAGGRALAARFDVTDEHAVREGIARIAATIGPVDVVVNNATGPQPYIALSEQTWEDHLDQLRFFVKAPLLLLQAVLPDWRSRKTGRVINIGSEVVEIGNPLFGHYVAAKGAMLGLTRSWARELGPEGIPVNLVAPGWIPVERHRDSDPQMLEDYRRQVAFERIGSPDDVASLVAYLASNEANFITGQTFAVNGGRTLA
ncbi:3-oxoacyl-ACP reductase (plasmid) [Paraburkholderia sp. PGU19]|uniref:SDR family oxidoreductase n=1 Tax=Paraburkholderia sp. PGU19 TaxID=2735434 RepID=UPI0015DAA512|nr:SDR family oxidoreductase [Paraburkholderia sp. PGU19]BCG04494.1 3-oxoacyl-ACP reductase [Paraburkholderia sp. PGU19]